ncbi:hypothetical protein [uncultured Arthrobacter sp.]|uniref:hypothetical protein n=1 Tax=uncultured Arthrobacter sp. TaxID=114050 RepID=UPI0032180949
MRHIEPEDRPKVQAYWERVAAVGGPLPIYVSIRDRKGRQHKLLFSADYILERTTPVGVWGVIVDPGLSTHEQAESGFEPQGPRHCHEIIERTTAGSEGPT